MLSDQLSGFFPSIDDKLLDWSFRKHLISSELLNSFADILCLSEVDHFEDFLHPLLGQKGYQLLFKRKKSWHRDGLCIAFKQDRLRLIRQESIYFPRSNQFALTAILLLGTVEILVVATHLKSGVEYERIRERQIKFLLTALKRFRVKNIVMCGDFNCEPKSLTYNAIVQSDLSLKSAYFGVAEVEKEPEITTYKKREDQEEFNTIDYIFIKGFKVRSVLQLPGLSEVSKSGLPSKDYPSDHLSLKCGLGLDFESRL
jgi:endonuclease/exonuclease/phosphatase family metal-dependent hydrolase